MWFLRGAALICPSRFRALGPRPARMTQLAFAHHREKPFGEGRELAPDQRVFVGALAGLTMRAAAVDTAAADTDDRPPERRCMDDTPKIRPIV